MAGWDAAFGERKQFVPAIRSVPSIPAPALGQFHVVRMADPEVPRERIVPRERLLLGAQMTAHFLLARIVDRVLVACEVVRPAENRVARFARRRINSFAFVRPVLRVP